MEIQAEKNQGAQGLLQTTTTAVPSNSSSTSPEEGSVPIREAHAASSLSQSSQSSKTESAIGRALSGGEQNASMTLYLSVLCCCISPVLFGITVAYTSPAQSTMEGDAVNGVTPPAYLEVMSSSAFSWYAALLNIGAVLGAFSGSFLSDRFGRKKTLMLTAVPHVIGWIGSTFASNASLLILLRIIIGWGVGVGSAVVPVYIGEVATTGLRGALGAANQLSVTGGIFFVNFLGTYVFLVDEGSEQFVQWRFICLLAGVSALLLGGMFFFPESPKWLAKQGRDEECSNALQRLRTGDCSYEVQMVLQEVSQEGTGAASGTATPSLGAYKKSVIIGIGLLSFQQLSGVNAVMMYTADICKDAGMSNSHQAAMLVMGLQVLLTGVSCLLMERAGRRLLLLVGSFCMTVGNFVLSYYFLTLDVKNMWGPPLLAIVGLVLFIVGFSLALGPIPWLILAELFPTEVRSKAASIATAANWSFSFVVCLSFLHLEEAITKQGTFLTFTIVCAILFTFVMLLVPETKGKTVDQVIEELQRVKASFGARVVSMQTAGQPPTAITVEN